MSLTVGETIGAYRIVEQLGQGGMATVFKAYHAALDRYVAIKVLHPAFKADPNFLARFQREARVVARLEHPNIVPVYDYAEHNGSPYLVMKFIEGETLKARLAREAMTLEAGLEIIQAVGAGLQYAHRQGILHRDIKPSNVMLAADGSIYLADFGLARIAMAGESTLSADSMLGTPHYMSPEQARGEKDLDAKTDIYSFGVVIYELVVGRVPYSADTPYAIIHDHIFSPLPLPHSINPNVPEAIERVLLKALAKERADRYADVAALVGAFKEAAGGAAPGVLALPQRPPVSPTAETPSAARGKKTEVAPARGAAARKPSEGAARDEAAPSDAQAKRRYTFRWWHAVVGVFVVGFCCLGLAAVASNRDANQRRTGTPPATPVAQATEPQLPPTDRPPPTDAPPPAESPPPEGDPIDSRLRAAEEAFRIDRVDEGLGQLDQIVALDPDNLEFLLLAGDFALVHSLALPALDRYYVPAVFRTQPPLEGIEVPVREHAALALYVAAADPGARDFLTGVTRRAWSSDYPDLEALQMALQRNRIFTGEGERAREELQAFLADNPRHPAALLILGDYFLSAGQPVEATARYRAAQETLPNRPLPAWIRIEAECGVRKLLDQRARAQLEPTCEDLSLLLTGR